MSLKMWIESALKESGWTFDQIMDGVQSGDFFLFENKGGCLVCEIISSPRHKVFHCFAAGGDLESLRPLILEAEAYGRLVGCDAAGGTGRTGWVRALRNMGYTAAVPAVEKEL